MESILGRKGDYDSTDNNIEDIVTIAGRTTEVEKGSVALCLLHRVEECLEMIEAQGGGWCSSATLPRFRIDKNVYRKYNNRAYKEKTKMFTELEIEQDNLLLLDNIIERFNSHEEEFDQPQRNDREIWKWVDKINKKTFAIIVEAAIKHKDFTKDHQQWSEKVLQRNPFQLRPYTKRFRSAIDNKMIWHMLMMFRERVKNTPKKTTNLFQTLFN